MCTGKYDFLVEIIPPLTICEEGATSRAAKLLGIQRQLAADERYNWFFLERWADKGLHFPLIRT
jgi:hypothetical protein